MCGSRLASSVASRATLAALAFARVPSAIRGRLRAMIMRNSNSIHSRLIQHAELVSQRDQVGATALHHAALGGHRCVVQELVSQGADLNATESQLGCNPYRLGDRILCSFN